MSKREISPHFFNLVVDKLLTSPFSTTLTISWKDDKMVRSCWRNPWRWINWVKKVIHGYLSQILITRHSNNIHGMEYELKYLEYQIGPIGVAPANLITFPKHLYSLGRVSLKPFPNVHIIRSFLIPCYLFSLQNPSTNKKTHAKRMYLRR